MLSMRNMSLRMKFLAGTVGIVVVLGMTMVLFVRTTLHQRITQVHQRRGLSLARSMADHGLDLVLTERYLQLDMVLRDEMNAEKDVKYIFVQDSHGKVLAHTFGEGFPAELRGINPYQPGDEYDTAHFKTEEGHISDIAVPLLNGTAGVLHLGLAGETVEEAIRNIVQQVIGIMLMTIVAGSIAVAIFTRFVTRPLLKLEGAVTAMGRGDLERRVSVSTNDEIGRLGAAFNSMAEKRKQTAEDRELLIGELREALENVKTLRGLIPICASCKKVRDDKGYWSQIEAYLTLHSGAEFSHGICPECAQKLYPDHQNRNKDKE